MTFLKSQAASLIASIIDLLVMILLVEVFGVWYGVASVIGNISGATTNFVIGRVWVFEATDKSSVQQAWKYALVWFGYVVISFLLLILVKDIFNVNYKYAKVLVAVVVGITYNYMLQRKFVFR
ncbi:GtrA family protein [Chryseosolibacter indicus]|uniref:GtrA family protein n=1 Tax=Chryseosolibacter indicus TaxID=2782351 RepID=A0ABS5VSS6_9BACT|nr:GtrA family protein [Chryseosolibacter indicus]MBT1704484.1 GtrA family protein [Chryseosolibacter indicus]